MRVYPFSTLPLEILTHIFALISSGVPNIRPLDLLPYPAWLPIIHVCHYWCTVTLSHAQLWTSITPGLSIPWIEVFIERSQMMVMDLKFLIHPTAWSHAENRLFCGDIIQLLKGFTRICSLYLTGNSIVIAPIMNTLCSLLPIQSLSICVERDLGELALLDDLFGGKAPIHHLQFIAKRSCHIIAPGCLLHDVTHFTTKMLLSSSALLNQLYPMSSLMHLEYWQPPELLWSYLHMPADTLPTSPIQMPQLMNMNIRA